MASGKPGRQEPQRSPMGLAVAYGTGAGLLAGCAVGLMFGKVLFWVAGGLCFGALAGLAVGLLLRKKGT